MTRTRYSYIEVATTDDFRALLTTGNGKGLARLLNSRKRRFTQTKDTGRALVGV